MPAKKQVPKEAIILAALNIVRESGIENINARSIAQKLKCSTQPIYLSFKGMDELKKAVSESIDNEYNSFFSKYTDINNYLVSIAKSHILFAYNERNLYKAMFLSNTMEGVSIEDIANASWNQKAIMFIVKDFKTDNYQQKRHL